jgi:RND superfamily putative drug exporter
MPLMITLPSIVVALGLVALLAQAFNLSIFVVNMLTGMGLALGIDYALFVVSRFREERGRGREQMDAIAATATTANRAVVFSGTTFVIAMFGMLVVPNSIMRSLAVGAIVVGAVSVVASATLLPALLGLIGDGVDRWRIPFFGRRSLEQSNPEGRFWGTIVRGVLRRPGLSLALAVAVLLALASPVLGMHVGTSGVTALPDRFESVKGYAALQRDFPRATTSPVEIVVDRAAAEPSTQTALVRLRTQLASDPRFGAGSAIRSRDGTVAALAVPVRGDPSGDRAVAAVRDLRSHVIPRTFERTDAEVLVGGTTSENIDYFDSVVGPAPWVIALVLGLTLVFLTIVFRSLVVAATSVLLNLLSVGAAYGLLVIVFRWGVGADVGALYQSSQIEGWIPIFLFAMLFGLSMDYEVFLVSRMREVWDETHDNGRAVAEGLERTGLIVSAAAIIMVAAFSGFVAGRVLGLQEFGIGLAVAIFIDATIVRALLVPALMALFGRWNWWLPRGIARIFRVRPSPLPAEN